MVCRLCCSELMLHAELKLSECWLWLFKGTSHNSAALRVVFICCLIKACRQTCEFCPDNGAQTLYWQEIALCFNRDVSSMSAHSFYVLVAWRPHVSLSASFTASTHLLEAYLQLHVHWSAPADSCWIRNRPQPTAARFREHLITAQ